MYVVLSIILGVWLLGYGVGCLEEYDGLSNDIFGVWPACLYIFFCGIVLPFHATYPYACLPAPGTVPLAASLLSATSTLVRVEIMHPMPTHDLLSHGFS